MNRKTLFNGNSQQPSHSRRQTQGRGNRRRNDENLRELDNGRRNNLHASHLVTVRSDDRSVHAHGSDTQTPPLQQRPLEAAENSSQAENHSSQAEFQFDFTAQGPDSKSFTTSTEGLRAAQVERRTQLFDSDKKSVILNNGHCHILSLPDDVLFLILSFLQPAELCQAGCVCRRFRFLTAQDSVWLQHAKRTAVVKPLSTWLMPWVQSADDGLWFSMGSSIHCFDLSASGHLREVKERCLHGLEEDATRFCVKKDRVVSGCRDGSVCCWDTSGKLMFCHKQVHTSDTQCVDFTDSVIISGSRDATCKVLPVEASSDSSDLVLQSFDAGERVWSLKISPCESFFAAGLAGCQDDPPIVIWDIDSGECMGQLSVNHRRGAGVLDLRFESPHELLTCGYDTFIRMWDLRTQSCVNQWEEPHDSALYCLESDGNNAILVGTARHGMVRLWDKRKTEPVQVYYSNSSRNSPVYSLAMNYKHLYLALDVGLNVLDFSCRKTDNVKAASSSCLNGW